MMATDRQARGWLLRELLRATGLTAALLALCAGVHPLAAHLALLR